MDRKLLLFEFQTLPEIMAVNKAASIVNAEVISVPRKHYNKTLKELLERQMDDKNGDTWTGGPLGGRMIVLCGVEEYLEVLLPAFAAAGVGRDCLKAVLTPSNQSWNAVRLYRELHRERQEMQKGQAR